MRVRVSVCGHDERVVKLPNAGGVAQIERGATIGIGDN